jgi:hypothetical protein
MGYPFAHYGLRRLLPEKTRSAQKGCRLVQQALHPHRADSNSFSTKTCAPSDFVPGDKVLGRVLGLVVAPLLGA